MARGCDMEVLYFAYGSNMSGARMARRVPTARHYGTATLYGWRLAERLYADIERWRGGKVRGVVYAMDVRGLLTLDGYEGFPNVYMGDDVRVKMDGSGRWVSAWTYFMTNTTRRRRAGAKFTPDYAAVCAAGAAENGLPTDFFNRRIFRIDAESKM